jgi:predicted dithiol-disulfide oxidoreductase (DUF899 family)
MPEHRVGSREEFLAARDALLQREKELTHRSDELARERLELPWVAIEKDYEFDTDTGRKPLAGLFDGRSQLIAYQFMFGPAYEAGCPMCSSVADGFDAAVPHLRAKDVTLIAISRAPLAKLQAFKKRMGWSFPWASSYGSDFNFDMQASQSDENVKAMLAGWEPTETVNRFAAECGTDPAGYLTEAPVLNSFALEDGVVYQTYTTTARGLEFMLGYYGLLDRAPLGRNEGDPVQNWQKRHDEY